MLSKSSWLCLVMEQRLAVVRDFAGGHKCSNGNCRNVLVYGDAFARTMSNQRLWGSPDKPHEARHIMDE